MSCIMDYTRCQLWLRHHLKLVVVELLASREIIWTMLGLFLNICGTMMPQTTRGLFVQWQFQRISRKLKQIWRTTPFGFKNTPKRLADRDMASGLDDMVVDTGSGSEHSLEPFMMNMVTAW